MVCDLQAVPAFKGKTGTAKGMVLVGAIAGAFGVKGEVRLRAFVEYARSRNVRLSMEPSSTATHDIGFLHSLADAIDLSRDTGIGVNFDLQNCWFERNLARTIRDLDVASFVLTQSLHPLIHAAAIGPSALAPAAIRLRSGLTSVRRGRVAVGAASMATFAVFAAWCKPPVKKSISWPRLKNRKRLNI